MQKRIVIHSTKFLDMKPFCWAYRVAAAFYSLGDDLSNFEEGSLSLFLTKTLFYQVSLQRFFHTSQESVVFTKNDLAQ